MSTQSNNNLPAPVTYSPAEVVGLFSDLLAKRSAGLIYVRGIYRPGKGVQYSGYYYDSLRDEASARELTIIVTPEIRSQLTDGCLVDLKGLIERRVTNDCSVRLALQVTGTSVVQEHTISEDDLKRIEIRNTKAKAGFKNVNGVLESAIYADRRPSVGLVFAESSIVDEDFNRGKEAAETALDFVEYRVSFARPDAFVRMLQDVDNAGHDIVCIIRGGGSGLEALDDITVLGCVAGMKTAVVTAVGHVADQVFINDIADLEIGTPSLLGTYFQSTVETVSRKKADSTAALTRKIGAQFKQQLETAEKQNKALQERVSELTKASTDAQKLHDEQVRASRQQLDGLSKQLANQSESFNRQLTTMQGNISALSDQNKNLSARYAQEKTRREAMERDIQVARKRRSFGLAVALIVLAILLWLGLR